MWAPDNGERRFSCVREGQLSAQDPFVAEHASASAVRALTAAKAIEPVTGTERTDANKAADNVHGFCPAESCGNLLFSQMFSIKFSPGARNNL